MKSKHLKVNTLYRCKGNHFLNSSEDEFIVLITNKSIENYERTHSYTIKAIKPSSFKGLFTYHSNQTELIVGSKYMPEMEELERTHPAWILYGKA